ncbi:universal stress protein [Halovenus marina]|uniref:universal stress protein n=1 Tax=Halovenus marina TaxID=3396621 RepID=UPI003F564A24
MERPLVVTDPGDRSAEMISEAGELAEAADVPLTVLTVVSDEEYSGDADVLKTISDIEGANYEMSAAEYAKEVAESAISDILSKYDIETEAVGRAVGDDDDRASEVLKTAERHDNDYIFLLGRRRSPAGKAVFGDTAQKVILNFDQYVVTLTE